MPFEDTCREAARLGCKGYDLEGPDDWPTLKKYGLIPTMYPPGPGGTIADALNRKENHDRLEKSMHAAHRRSRGQRCAEHHHVLRQPPRDDSTTEGADNCVAYSESSESARRGQGRHYLHGAAEQQSEPQRLHVRPHRWGVDVMKRVNSPRVKLLYDIYHLQIMEGDIARTIRDNFQCFGHFHTGGNPGRHEIDERRS